MHKLLIVDDERFIRKGLQTLISELDTGFKEIFEARNGREALKVLSRENISLVITDIRMPDMDGIRLMQEVQNLNQKPEFIVLSGYNDFQYAREAMKCGAREYLLKPVKVEELKEALVRIEQKILLDEADEQKKERALSLINQFKEDEIKLILLDEKLGEADIEKITRSINMDLLSREFFVAVLEERQEKNAGNWNRGLQVAILLDKYFSDAGNTDVYILNIKGQFVLVSSFEPDYEDVARDLKQKTGVEFVISLGEKCGSAADLRRGYSQACHALKYKLFYKGTRFIRYVEVVKPDGSFTVPVESIKKIPALVGTGKAKELDVLLNGIFHWDRVASTPIGYYEKVVDSINHHVVSYFKEHLPQKTADMSESCALLESLNGFDHISDYYSLLHQFLMEMQDFIRVLKETYASGNDIDAAIAYMKKNYNKDLSMTMVANFVSLNYTYFSYLFAERTGMSFVDYIRKIRIEKARELLDTSNYQINEIAERVGYKDAKYFAKSFRAVMGVSPLEYRSRTTGTKHS